jgi:hypothetical protein
MHLGLVWIEACQAACRPGSDLSPRRPKSNAWERCFGQAKSKQALNHFSDATLIYQKGLCFNGLR